MSDFRPAPLVRVVDDDPTVCQSMQFVLEIAGFQVKPYLSAAAFLEGDDASRAGCVILDVRMPGMSGLELQHEMARRRLRLPVIFLTGHGDIAMAVEALHDGAADFLVKPPDADKLIAVVQKAVAADRQARRVRAERERLAALVAGLTPAEREAAALIGKGLHTSVIAGLMGVKEATVKVYRSAVYRKLDALNPVEVSQIMAEVGAAEDGS